MGRIWAKILSLVLPPLSGKHNPWILLIHRHLDVRVTLIILHHGIVLRAVLLNQVTLQYQGFKLRVSYYVFKMIYVFNHPLYLGRMPVDALKVLADSVFKAYRLTHIDNFIELVVHNVDSRLPRQLLKFFFYVKHLIPLFLRLFYICSFLYLYLITLFIF